MKLPKQNKSVAHKTYNADAVSVGANASFSFGSLIPVGVGALRGALSAIG